MRPRRQPRRHRRERLLHIRSRQLRQPDGTQFLAQRLAIGYGDHDPVVMAWHKESFLEWTGLSGSRPHSG
jgi:hypothetical protein